MLLRGNEIECLWLIISKSNIPNLITLLLPNPYNPILTVKGKGKERRLTLMSPPHPLLLFTIPTSARCKTLIYYSHKIKLSNSYTICYLFNMNIIMIYKHIKYSLIYSFTLLPVPEDRSKCQSLWCNAIRLVLLQVKTMKNLYTSIFLICLNSFSSLFYEISLFQF